MTCQTIRVQSHQTIYGEVEISGAKNAALPLIVGACLGEDFTTLDNVPLLLQDVGVLIELLHKMGAEIEVDKNRSCIRCRRANFGGGEVPVVLASRIRYSLLLLGMATTLRQSIFLPIPGGCAIGDRKYDLHIMGLRQLGAMVEERPDGIAVTPQTLQGTNIDFYLPTTSGSENIILASVLTPGITRIRNANTRPEVVQLGELLTEMGAKVKSSNRIIEIEGVDRLKGGAHMAIMPGWDEAITYMIAACATRGEISIKNFNLQHVAEDVRYLTDIGIGIFEWGDNVYVTAKKRQLLPFELFTAPYPGVNSDMQPIFASLALSIPGTSVVTDLRFTDRFKYVGQLNAFGAQIQAYGNSAIIDGGKPLYGTRVIATDLRGGAACLITGLQAEGETIIDDVYQIERGYENFREKFQKLGVTITEIAPIDKES